jgi:predicted DNA-binding transcriptional regulator AlpA
MSPTNDPPALLRAAELQERLQISESVMRKWIADGTIPRSAYIRIGYVYRFDYAKVYAALFDAADAAETAPPVQLELPLDDVTDNDNIN